MSEFANYCSEEADSDGDSAPLYIFDPQILTRQFTDGTKMTDEYTIPVHTNRQTHKPIQT